MISQIHYEWQKVRLESLSAYKAEMLRIDSEIERLSKYVTSDSRERTQINAQMSTLKKSKQDISWKLSDTESKIEEFHKLLKQDKEHYETFGDLQRQAHKEVAKHKRQAEDNQAWFHSFNRGEVTIRDTVESILKMMEHQKG